MARRRCPVCGSKQWRKEAASGLITCTEGHVLQGYRNEITEVTELGPHQLRKRALKSGRKKKEKTSKADPKVYYGARGRFHYFQCLQLILRLQIHALIKLWELPSEFEVVCRDIWALHLELLPSPPPAEPLLHQLDVGGIVRSRVPGANTRREPPDVTNNVNPDKPKNDGESTDSEQGEEDEDSEMERFLQEASESPSETSSDSDGNPKAGAQRAEAKSWRRVDAPTSNVSVLILACWILRIPVMYQDFIRLIESYDLPYLDPLRLLPTSLSQHLSKYSIQGLSPQNAPNTLHLHRLTSRLAKNLHKKFGVATAEMNALPMLWRAVRCFEGTPALYQLSKKLGVVLSIPNTLHHTLAPMLKTLNGHEPQFHKMDNAPVEVALAATVVIVVKLVYGLDGTKRFPSFNGDPAYALPELSDLLDAIKRGEEMQEKAKDTLLSSAQRKSVLLFDDETIDDYLEFCQRALLSREDRDPNTMAEYFPLPPSIDNSPSVNAPSAKVVSENPMNAISGTRPAGSLLPGESYKIYNARDVLGALPVDFEVVVGRAAQWTGVGEDYICRVVEYFERRLKRWWIRKQKGAEEAGDSTNSEDSEQDDDDLQ